MLIQKGDFKLHIKEGDFSNSQIVVLLGENGTGKTTFVRTLAGFEKQHKDKVPELAVSFKPQTIAPKFEGTVADLFWEKIKNCWETNILFKTHVFKYILIINFQNTKIFIDQ